MIITKTMEVSYELMGTITVESGDIYIGDDLQAMIDYRNSPKYVYTKAQIQAKYLYNDDNAPEDTKWYDTALKVASIEGDGEFSVYLMRAYMQPIGYFIDTAGIIEADIPDGEMPDFPEL